MPDFPPIFRHLQAVAACTLICGLSLTACGGATPLGGSGSGSSGYPAAATKNTTRISGSGSPEHAAAASLAVWPGAGQRPNSIALVPGDWQAAIAATPLVAAPFHSAILIADGDISDSTQSAINRLNPRGVPGSKGLKLIRIGQAADPGGSQRIDGNGPAALADAIDRSRLTFGATATASVIVVGTEGGQWAMPAAALAARSGAPVLFAERNALPGPTVQAIKRHGRPAIILLAPESTVSKDVASQLAALGSVVRVTGPDPSAASVALARYKGADVGWGVRDAGHGFVFARSDSPLDAAAAAPLSASGTWGPLLVLDGSNSPPAPISNYLLDVQPGFRDDPTRGVYNHGWLIGDTSQVSTDLQATIDRLLEITPAHEQIAPTAP